MARRKRKEEEPAWTPPEFDEVGFMRTEMEGAKASVATIGWAVAGALISYFLFANGQPITGFFAGLLFAVGLFWVMPRLRIGTHRFKRKDWVGHGVTYFFSWLAFWILLINVPFGDFTSPTVHEVLAGGFSSSLGTSPRSILCVGAVGGSITVPIGSNDSLYILFRATDNVGISSVTMRIGTINYDPVSVAGQASVCTDAAEGQTFVPGSYAVTLTDPLGPSGPYDVVITAYDGAGHAGVGRVTILTP